MEKVGSVKAQSDIASMASKAMFEGRGVVAGKLSLVASAVADALVSGDYALTTAEYLAKGASVGDDFFESIKERAITP